MLSEAVVYVKPEMNLTSQLHFRLHVHHRFAGQDQVQVMLFQQFFDSHIHFRAGISRNCCLRWLTVASRRCLRKLNSCTFSWNSPATLLRSLSFIIEPSFSRRSFSLRASSWAWRTLSSSPAKSRCSCWLKAWASSEANRAWRRSTTPMRVSAAAWAEKASKAAPIKAVTRFIFNLLCFILYFL